MAAAIRKRTAINYLSNSELLHEINESKKTFSYFIDDKYSDYTSIVESLDDITDEVISKAKDIKAHQINQKNLRRMLKQGMSKKEIEEEVQATAIGGDAISMDQLVFRIMTFDHIPEEIQQNKKNLLNRIKFPPFKHYGYIDGEWREVGRSHWVNGLDNGNFSVEQGKITNNLCNSLIKLVDRYGTRGNFNGYTYLADMKGQALLQLSLVAIQFNESKGNNPFSYYTRITHTSFLKILKNEKVHRDIRDELLQAEAGMSSHSWQMDHET